MALHVNVSFSVIIGRYIELIKPNLFVSQFKDKAEFCKWCEEGTKEDLQCTLKAFEDAEAYEWCSIINEVLKGKEYESKNKETKGKPLLFRGNAPNGSR